MEGRRHTGRNSMGSDGEAFRQHTENGPAPGFETPVSGKAQCGGPVHSEAPYQGLRGNVQPFAQKNSFLTHIQIRVGAEAVRAQTAQQAGLQQRGHGRRAHGQIFVGTGAQAQGAAAGGQLR